MSKKNWRINLIEDALKFGIKVQDDKNKFLSSEQILLNAEKQKLGKKELDQLKTHIENKKPQTTPKKQTTGKQQVPKKQTRRQIKDKEDDYEPVKMSKIERKRKLKQLLMNESLLSKEQIKEAINLF